MINPAGVHVDSFRQRDTQGKPKENLAQGVFHTKFYFLIRDLQARRPWEWGPDVAKMMSPSSRIPRALRLVLSFAAILLSLPLAQAQEKPQEPRAYLTSPSAGTVLMPKALTLEAVTVDGSEYPVTQVEFLASERVIATVDRPGDQPKPEPGTKIQFKALWENVPFGLHILKVRALSGEVVVALSDPVAVLAVGIPPPPPTPTLRVAITSPSAGTKVTPGDPITVSAKVAGDEPIQIVSFYAIVNGQTQEIGTATQEPWQVDWKPREPGLALLYAKAGSRTGSARSDSVPVLVMGIIEPPLPPALPIRVGIVSPKTGELLKPGTSLTVAAEAKGDEPIESVSFEAVVDGRSEAIGTDSEAPWAIQWTVPEGRVAVLTAIARSKTAKGISVRVAVRIASQPDPVAPLVWLKPHGDVVWISGVPLPLVVQANEADGAFKSVEFFDGETSLGDGSRLTTGGIVPSTTSLFVLDWKGTAGTHVLGAMGHRTDGSTVRVDGPNLTLKDPTEPPRPAWVRITTPDMGSFVSTPEVSLQAVVFETPDAPISTVEFVVDATVVATAKRPADAPASSPDRKLLFEARWTQPVAGMHVLHARAISGERIVAKSEPLRFVFGEAKPPVPPDILPKVLIASPQNGDRIPAGQPLEIVVKPTTTEAIESVEFLAISGGELKELGTATQEPWSFTWKEPTEGLSLLMVRARIGNDAVRSFPTLVVIGDGIVWGRDDIKAPGAGVVPGIGVSEPDQPRIAPLRPTRDGRHELVMVGGDDGTPMDLEASEDLVHWTRVARGVLNLGATMDVNATTESKKGLFYRLVPAAP